MAQSRPSERWEHKDAGAAPSDAWRERSLCRYFGVPTERYFPVDGKRTEGDPRLLCYSCPVRSECLTYALSGTYGLDGITGVWGGFYIGSRPNARGTAAALEWLAANPPPEVGLPEPVRGVENVVVPLLPAPRYRGEQESERDRIRKRSMDGMFMGKAMGYDRTFLSDWDRGWRDD